jgi:hypothetical protein
MAIADDNRIVRGTLKVILGVMLLVAVGGTGWLIWRAEQNGVFEAWVTGEKKAEPNLARYEVLVDELKRWREDLAEAYQEADNAEQRAEIEHDAKVVLEMVLPEMMRCWIGTGYDFNGIAEKPGKGRVACGYFVSTVIRDAGFKVNRYKLAQQPSENILRTFIEKEDCLLSVGKEFESYVDWLEELEPGVYLIGLDTHVGFIVNRRDGMGFIHSSGAHLVGVVEEPRDQAAAMRNSRWRMIGSFTGDRGVVRTWLGGKKIQVVE